MSLAAVRRALPGAALAAGVAGALAIPPAAAADTFPSPRPGGRTQAALVLSGSSSTTTCLNPLLAPARGESAPPALRRAERVLRTDVHVAGERTLVAGDGTSIRYTLDRNAPDRIEDLDLDGDGRPDALQAVLRGLEDVHALAARLDLPASGPADVLLAQLSGTAGYVLPGNARARALLVLDASPEGGAAGLRAQAIHQEAHRILGPGAPPDWAEAFASWAELALLGADDRRLAFLSTRLARMGEGLPTGDLGLMAGNAAWFAFVHDAYGSTGVRLTLQELAASPTDAASALDRALRRAAGVGLTAAFREFQVWSALVGRRDDGRHFSFAAGIDGPRDAASADGLPALSVQSDPPVSPLGAATVRLAPGETGGGLSIRFEGEAGGAWEADLLVHFADGRRHLVPVELDEDGGGETTLPLTGLDEVLLLVRNVARPGEPARRYTWAAYRERGYPFELQSFEVTQDGAGMRHVTWETAGERDLVGFDLVRVRVGTRESVRINPVWIPSLGAPEETAAYAFDDPGAEPGAAYVYRIEGITSTGLVSPSEGVLSKPLPR
ncbi:MAG TPA: hypothetical protein VFV75_20925 [Candidatus Polarisedimenticolaceae bacterium]|nr:hypothetical protein [Candidatus Polarisedimenticolaceae bacterium]